MLPGSSSCTQRLHGDGAEAIESLSDLPLALDLVMEECSDLGNRA